MSEIDSTGAVSVRPYPEKQVQPSFSSTSRTRVGEDAAPPIEIHCRLLKSYFCRSGEFTSAMAMAGTTLNECTRSRSINLNTSAGSKRCINHWVQPMHVKEWPARK